MKYFQNIFKQILFSFGVVVTRTRKSEKAEFVKSLQHFDINVLFDVGANEGQFATEIRKAGYTGKIICFEPIPEAHKILTDRFIKDDNTIIHPPTAVGESTGDISFNVAGNSVSSSILPMLKTHSDAAPESTYVKQITAKIDTLDNLINIHAQENDNVFIKIDTQGYEWMVLNGAKESLKFAKGLVLELSLTPLYEDQKLWKPIVSRLENEGFKFWKILRGFTDSKTGRTLQFDGVFFRE